MPKEGSERLKPLLDLRQASCFASWLANRRLGRSGKQIAERLAETDLIAGWLSGPAPSVGGKQNDWGELALAANTTQACQDPTLERSAAPRLPHHSYMCAADVVPQRCPAPLLGAWGDTVSGGALPAQLKREAAGRGCA